MTLATTRLFPCPYMLMTLRGDPRTGHSLLPLYIRAPQAPHLVT